MGAEEAGLAEAMPARERLAEFLRKREGRSPAVLAAFRGLKTSERGIDRVSYSHAAMADLIIATPWITQRDIAKHFGYTECWVSQIFASDAFQSYFAARREELLDPTLVATLEENFKSLVLMSAQKLRQKMEDDKLDADQLANVIGVASKALGYGARSGAAVQVNNQFVVQVPAKLASSSEWEAAVMQGRSAAALNEAAGTPALGSPSGSPETEKEAA